MRTPLKSIAKAATLGLAITFTLSCSSGDDGDNPGNGAGTGISSSSGGSNNPSSSSGGSSSSSGIGIVYGTPVAYEGETYQTVVIGTQTWMARNLNYNASGSKCYNNSDSCATYGRLYDWETARTVCPTGWHLPSDAEWDALTTAVGGSSTAGTKLKSARGWNTGGGSIPGTDDYGFSALPGGYRSLIGSFFSSGLHGYWWSATEYDASGAYSRDIGYTDAKMGRHFYNFDKDNLYSVRCVQDNPSSSGTSSPSNGNNSSSSGAGNGGGGNVVYGTPVAYEGETYKTVVIGTQTWMARNLNYNASGSKCYDNSDANCATYGKLYDWATAMALPSSCNSSSCASQIQPKHRGICPENWHLPSDAEWDALTTAAGGSSTAGTKLKSARGWDTGGVYELGTDDYGFSALPGGDADGIFGIFSGAGFRGCWWSATENIASYAYGRFMDYDDAYVSRSHDGKTDLSSVRCVRD